MYAQNQRDLIEQIQLRKEKLARKEQKNRDYDQLNERRAQAQAEKMRREYQEEQEKRRMKEENV
jgi:hypothetical protein